MRYVVVTKLEPVAVAAHPALQAGGVADHEGIIRDVFGDDGTGADEAVAPKRDPADDGCIGADGCASTDDRIFIQAVAVDLATGIGDIGQDAGCWGHVSIIDNWFRGSFLVPGSWTMDIVLDVRHWTLDIRLFWEGE